MYHFFVRREQITSGKVTVTGPDVNHIKNVLRMRRGESVLISDGEGGDYLCSFEEADAEKAGFTVISAEEAGRELPAKLYLFQGLPKGDKMELIIQKAVELGVYQVVPVETGRTVVKLEKKKKEARVRRWNAIAESAAKQSGRGIVPEVTEIMSFSEALSCAAGLDVSLIPYERAENMAETKRQFARVRPGVCAGIFIGPEGGFEDSEIEAAVLKGLRPVTLGRRILRTETAGLAALAALMFQLEE